MTPGGLTPDVLDVGNPLLTPCAARLDLTVVSNPATGAEALIATLRTTSGCLTVWLDRDGAESWRDSLDAKIAKMTRLILPPGLPPLGLNGGRPG